MMRASSKDPSSTPQENKEKDRIIHRLTSNGEYDRLEQLLAADLFVNAEWLESMQQSLPEGISFTELTLEDLVAAFVPAGKESVPPAIKAKMMCKIREVLKKQGLESDRQKNSVS